MSDRERVYNAEGRLVGFIVGDEFHKHVNPEVHRYQNPPSYAVDTEVFMRLKARGIRLMRVHEEWMDGRNTELSVTMEDFERYAFKRDHNFQPQMFLPLRYWVHEGGAPVKPPVVPPKPDQGRLF